MQNRGSVWFLCVVLPLLLIQSLVVPGFQHTSSTIVQFMDGRQEIHSEVQTHASIVQNPENFGIQHIYDPREILDQNQSLTDGVGVRFTNASWYFAQRIEPSVDILTKISILVKRYGTFPAGSMFTISLRKYLQVDLILGVLDPSTFSENESWIEWNVSYLPIAKNESYYLVCHLANTSEHACIEWLYGTNNPYERGRPYYSQDGREWSEYDPDHLKIDFCFKTKGIRNTPPDQPQKPQGPTEGQYEKDYTFSTMTSDAEGDQVYYLWDWGDGHQSAWLGPYKSGEQCSAIHSWLIQGSYLIKVKAKDSWGFKETCWSEELTVRMKKTRSMNLLNFLMGLHQY